MELSSQCYGIPEWCSGVHWVIRGVVFKDDCPEIISGVIGESLKVTGIIATEWGGLSPHTPIRV